MDMRKKRSHFGYYCLLEHENLLSYLSIFAPKTHKIPNKLISLNFSTYQRKKNENYYFGNSNLMISWWYDIQGETRSEKKTLKCNTKSSKFVHKYNLSSHFEMEKCHLYKRKHWHIKNSVIPNSLKVVLTHAHTQPV